MTDRPANEEISAAVAAEIASWRRVFGHAKGKDGRGLLRRAAAHLWRVLKIDATVSPAAAAVTHQAVMDALADYASAAGIFDDDAQLIIAEAKTSAADDAYKQIVAIVDAAGPALAPEIPDSQAGKRPRRRRAEIEADDGVKQTSANDEYDTEPDARPPEFSDEALALAFAARHAARLRYVAAWNKWLIWNGHRWREDSTLHVFHLVRRICRQVASVCDKPKLAADIASASTVAAVERLARADRRLAASTDQWDADPWLLNTPAGVVDLHTGKLRPHSLDDYATKVTGIAPDGGCPIVTWLKFLQRVTKGDGDLIGFLQRMCGYALTGLTREHALFFVWGPGGNGKGTFVNALIGSFGNYHRTAPIETFVASKTDRHPTELAGLRGARLVTATETEEGRRWAESKIKQITGGDRIAARFMRGDFFEFDPLFKLLISGNHRPGLRSVDEAIRRRLHMLNFDVMIPAAERDGTLGDKLKAEWPGILAWMIEGCLLWQAHGLAPSTAVQVATDNYLQAEDSLGAWAEQAGTRDAEAFELSADLYRSWKSFAERSGEWVGSLRKFVQRLEDRGDVLGIRKGRDGQGRRGFVGLRLVVPTTNGEEPPASADRGEPPAPADWGDIAV